ncbi:hypothetical protein PV416_07540 [Streptomyces ipomoeae]|nr:hypothetical protein [Streptomyces ipomoeae]MDX2693407.1 hypothetical protein [Streptomyces ipomoeae]MDX2820946.1 hypothetical protein [Streptomyces ipomoeae]MDX2839040.1 hypothetical protein [Streptomyces ipomoeae]MDX2880956.1 hypothetical protein [Streptomyces ipomoeae]MDX2931981.1 hypothetical protein [Streptomyces ipomoeae]
MRVRIRDVVRLRGALRQGSAPGDAEFRGRVCSELAADLPDEDLGEYLNDAIDTYRMGSKPRCEEVEYLEMVREAIDRIEEGE